MGMACYMHLKENNLHCWIQCMGVQIKQLWIPTMEECEQVQILLSCGIKKEKLRLKYIYMMIVWE